MKRETEVKFFVDDLDKVRRLLEKLGAKFEWKGRERDVFLDTPARTLKRKKNTLRVRDSYGKVLTLKEPTGREDGEFKVRKETEARFDDIEALLYILKRLGFKPWFKYTKPNREYWRYRDASVTLNSFPFGKFVEIESSKSEIRRIAKELGLDFLRSSTKSYIRLLSEYRTKHLKKK